MWEHACHITAIENETPNDYLYISVRCSNDNNSSSVTKYMFE